MAKKLENMTIAELQERYLQVTGNKPKSSNKKVLVHVVKEAEAEKARSERQPPAAPVSQVRGGTASAAAANSLPTPSALDVPPTDVAAPRADARNQASTATATAAPRRRAANEAPQRDVERETVADAAGIGDVDSLDDDQGALHDDGGLADEDVRDEEEDVDGNDAEEIDDDSSHGQSVSHGGSDVAPTAIGPRETLDGKTVEELRALYLAKVGRPTRSDSISYLKMKIREAEKGQVTAGSAHGAGGTPRTTRRFEIISTVDLQKLYEEKAQRTPTGLEREALIAGIIRAEKAAARATKRFADVTVENLQKLLEDLTGEATKSLVRDELIGRILQAESDLAGSRMRWEAREPGKPRVPVPFGMHTDARDALDRVLPRHRYDKRIDFLRDAVREKLERLGENSVAVLFSA